MSIYSLRKSWCCFCSRPYVGYPSKFSYIYIFEWPTLISLINIYWVSSGCQAWCWVLRILRWSPMKGLSGKRERRVRSSRRKVSACFYIEEFKGMHGLPTLQGKAAFLDAVGFQEWLGVKGCTLYSRHCQWCGLCYESYRCRRWN